MRRTDPVPWVAGGARHLTEQSLGVDMAMATRAAQALQSHELSSCLEGARVAELAIKLERLISGQPSESTAISVERITRDEIARFTTSNPVDSWDDDDDDEVEVEDGEPPAALPG